MKNWEDFSDIWVFDFEFISEGNPQIPICYVAKNITTGEVKKQWLYGKKELPSNPINEKNLFIAFYASAEIGCFISLGLPIPPFILDLYAEFRVLTNGLPTPQGKKNLISACQYYGIIGSSMAYKDIMRDRIIQGPPYSEKEQQDILKYCQQDVEMTAKLFEIIKDKIELQYALLRGRYMASLAQIEYNGIPIDIEKLAELKNCWDIIKEKLIWRIDQQYQVYEGMTFKIKNFRKYLEKHKIPWDYTPHGLPKTDDNYFKEQAKIHPELKPLQELRYAMGQLRLNDLQVGSDGRNRCILSAFASITGRNQPSSSKFIFGNSTWLRHLIKPTKGMAISYIDYEQQELAIAGILSQDKTMIYAYNSGDFYLSFAKSAGAIPPEGTKQTHPNERDLFKTATLAINYGMGINGLAKRIGKPRIDAKNILDVYKRTYKTYWDWNQEYVDRGILSGKMQTRFHWYLHTSFIKKQNTLKNWPMQSHGADILRLAICFCIEHRIKIIAPVHDAILIEAPIEEIDEKVKLTQKLMGDAAEYVVGFRIRTDVKTFRFPERYSEPRGKVMWDYIWDILGNKSSSEKKDKVYEKLNKGTTEDFEVGTE